MENSYKYFENTECKYYPCHKGIDRVNCLFCYCPLYHRNDCPGNPRYVLKDSKTVKVCTDCIFPHLPENYEAIIQNIRNGK